MTHPNENQIKELEALYSETMNKLEQLQKMHKQILAQAKNRVEQEQLASIRKSLT